MELINNFATAAIDTTADITDITSDIDITADIVDEMNIEEIVMIYNSLKKAKKFNKILGHEYITKAPQKAIKAINKIAKMFKSNNLVHETKWTIESEAYCSSDGIHITEMDDGGTVIHEIGHCIVGLILKEEEEKQYTKEISNEIMYVFGNKNRHEMFNIMRWTNRDEDIAILTDLSGIVFHEAYTGCFGHREDYPMSSLFSEAFAEFCEFYFVNMKAIKNFKMALPKTYKICKNLFDRFFELRKAYGGF